MVDLQTVSIMIASASVVAGIVYYTLQIRHQTKIRKTDLLVRLYQTITSSEFVDAQWRIVGLQVKDYEDYVKQYGSVLSENPMHKSLVVVAGFYELLGILVLRKRADIEEIYDVVGIDIPRVIYEKIKPLTLGLRREAGGEFVYAGFEYLLNELTREEPRLRKTWAQTKNIHTMK